MALADNMLEKAGLAEKVQAIAALKRGGFSNCYKLKFDSGALVLKIRRDDKNWRLKREYKLLSNQQLAAQNLGPKIVNYDESGEITPSSYLLEEFVEGTHPVEGNVPEEFLRAAAKWYSKLHGVTSNRLEESEHDEQEKDWINSLSLWLKRDEDQIETADRTSRLKKETLESVELVLSHVKELFSRYDKVFTRNTYNLIHADPAAENIFIQPDGSLKFIDWDFAEFNVFEADLAMFAYSWELTEEQERTFLTHYGLDINKDTMIKFYLMQLKFLMSDTVDWLLGVADEDFDTPVMGLVKNMTDVMARLRRYESD